MKRRLALLLALSLTLATVPVTGAAAAENTAAGTEVVTETVQEEAEADAAEETTVADPTVEDEGETVVDATITGTENQEVTTENNEDVTDTTTTEVTGEGNTTDAVNTEVAAVVEPGTGEGLVVTDPVVEVETLAKGTWKQNQGKWYYVNEDGSNYTGWLFLNGRKYYLDENGVMQTGWVKVDDTWYYLDEDGALQTNSWVQEGRIWYYVDENGVMKTGPLKLGNNEFFFKDNGVMVTGWLQNGENWNYYDKNGYKKKNSWVESYGSWYLMDEEGNMRTGWYDNGYNKFFFKDNGVMTVGWSKNDNKWYYFDRNGYMKKGWVLSYGSWYFMDNEGIMQTGWKVLGNETYYLNPGSGAMAADATKINGVVYYFDTNGKLAKTEGWKINRNSNWLYYTYANGTTAVNKTISGFQLDSWGGMKLRSIDLKAQNYGSRTDYLILVNKADFNVVVYWYAPKGGVWIPWKSWDCTHGGSLTPVGQWELEARVTKRDAYWGWAEFDYSSAAFAISISAGNFFHSILFDKLYEGNNYGSEYGGLNPYNRHIRDGAMRRDYSNSCIRLELPNAEWLYRNVPMGTKVVIY